MKVSRGASLDRFYILKLFGFGIFLHRIHHSDPPGVFHSHPWNGISLIAGSYEEQSFTVASVTSGRSSTRRKIESQLRHGAATLATKIIFKPSSKMRENETRIGGNHWGMFSIFEPGELRPGRLIDQSVVAWRLASRATGTAAFENPRSVIQRTVSMVTHGSNASHHHPGVAQHLRAINERARVNYFYGDTLPYDPEELERTISRTVDRTIPIIYRRRSASEVRMEQEEARFRQCGYPSPEQVAEIQRRFRNPELELAQREYIERMTTMIFEPMPIRNAD